MRNNKGFTLLEVMIAVFVLAIGLLGVAALQMTGVKNNHSANIRTQATELSYNLADRMRANIEGTVAGNYLGSAGPGVAFNCGLASPATYPAGNTCTDVQMAQADLDQWFALAIASIPLVQGVGNTQITCNDADGTDADPCTRGSRVTIQITWNEQGTNGVANQSFLSMDFQP
jgi:type IV pilus assembly protein PilV